MTAHRSPLSFSVEARAGAARAGVLRVRGRAIETPCFMPVGTAATVKAMRPADLAELDYGLVLANTYHLALRPGADVIERLGGLHRFMGFDGAILTDSGGYQVFSLAQRARLDDQGVTFQSHIDGAQLALTPEHAMQIQHQLGSDIRMVLDECPPYTASRAQVESAVERTTAWAARSLAEHRRLAGHDAAVFGIVQGGVHGDLRARSAAELIALPFDGFALGGLAVGEPNDALHRIAGDTLPALPEDRPRYLMGVGMPHDLLLGAAAGADLFDCVVPTRHARNAQLFTSQGVLKMRNARHREDASPPDPGCACATCRNFSRAYLRHLFLAGEILASMLATYHNLAFFRTLMRDLRRAIQGGTLDAFLERTLPMFEEHDDDASDENPGA